MKFSNYTWDNLIISLFPWSNSQHFPTKVFFLWRPYSKFFVYIFWRLPRKRKSSWHKGTKLLLNKFLSDFIFGKVDKKGPLLFYRFMLHFSSNLLLCLLRLIASKQFKQFDLHGLWLALHTLFAYLTYNVWGPSFHKSIVWYNLDGFQTCTQNNMIINFECRFTSLSFDDAFVTLFAHMSRHLL